MILKLGMQHRVLGYYQVYSNDDPGLTLNYFTARSNLVPYAFVLEKGKTMDFSETFVVYDLKLATDDRSDRKFLLTSKLYTTCPGAIYPLLPRCYIHVLNHEKCIKSEFKEISLKLATKWVKWKGLSVDINILSPGGCLALPRCYIHVLNHEKNCIKSDFKQMNEVTRHFC